MIKVDDCSWVCAYEIRLLVLFIFHNYSTYKVIKIVYFYAFEMDIRRWMFSLNFKKILNSGEAVENMLMAFKTHSA